MRDSPSMAPERGDLEAATDHAIRAIPPLWPLAISVAVNPYLGQSGESLAKTAARLARVAGARVTMPRAWYQALIDSGRISESDLSHALESAPDPQRPKTLADLKATIAQVSPPPAAVPTVADLAAAATGIDWPGLIAERLGAWAAGYFDEGQALWAAPHGNSAYAVWRAAATHDLTPEIIGLSGFASFVSDSPDMAHAARWRAVQRLGLPAEALATYFHQLLMTLGGWAHYARYQLWQAELEGRSDDRITDLLTIRLLWEQALYQHCHPQIRQQWEESLQLHATPVLPTEGHVVDAILQEAAERAAQRGLARLLGTASVPQPVARPAVQAVFCIDVRSEVFRRALESVNPAITTHGFAGFFGIATEHRRFASDMPESRLPVLLTPSLSSRSGGVEDRRDADSLRIKARAKRAWGRFKLAAVSSFAFVEAILPLYVVKLLRDAFALNPPAASPDPPPHFDPAPDLATRTGIAEGVLRAMMLTGDFARLVLLIGHGASVVNNPHASALNCGACGGNAGDVNARLLASLLNDPSVRAALLDRGIIIPADSLFLGAVHDTTTDRITLFESDHASRAHGADIDQAKAWLAAAGKIARGERALRLPNAANGAALALRSRDWSQIRPEWALAGCQAFIAAPRRRTIGRNLDGRAFLHDYDWTQDASFTVLELILTAPVVVASWISLQYYGSTVSPQIFGAGNKLLHNVAGGIGVLEGNGGLLRAGLPWQSVYDGEKLQHEPLRLSVCIEAPPDAMTAILRRHDGLRALFDHRWLHLFALDGEGRMAWRYQGDLRWAAEDAAIDD